MKLDFVNELWHVHLWYSRLTFQGATSYAQCGKQINGLSEASTSKSLEPINVTLYAKGRIRYQIELRVLISCLTQGNYPCGSNVIVRVFNVKKEGRSFSVSIMLYEKDSIRYYWVWC